MILFCNKYSVNIENKRIEMFPRENTYIIIKRIGVKWKIKSLNCIIQSWNEFRTDKNRLREKITIIRSRYYSKLK